MTTEKLIAGIVLFLIGLLFFFNNKNIGKGAFRFYRWFYTKERLIIMFKVLGLFLAIIGLIIAFSNNL